MSNRSLKHSLALMKFPTQPKMSVNNREYSECSHIMLCYISRWSMSIRKLFRKLSHHVMLCHAMGADCCFKGTKS